MVYIFLKSSFSSPYLNHIFIFLVLSAFPHFGPLMCRHNSKLRCLIKRGLRAAHCPFLPLLSLCSLSSFLPCGWNVDLSDHDPTDALPGLLWAYTEAGRAHAPLGVSSSPWFYLLSLRLCLHRNLWLPVRCLVGHLNLCLLNIQKEQLSFLLLRTVASLSKVIPYVQGLPLR